MRTAALLLVSALALLALPAPALALSIEAELTLAPDELTGPPPPEVEAAFATMLAALEEGGFAVCADDVCWLVLPTPEQFVGSPTPLSLLWCQALECSPIYVVYATAGTAADFAAQLAADLEAKGQVVTSIVYTVTGNLAGQTNAAVALVAGVVAGALSQANFVIELETSALPMCGPECTIIDTVIFTKNEAEALALAALDGAPAPFVVVVFVQDKAAEAVATANWVLTCECDSLLQATVLVQVIVGNVIFAKNSAEAIAIGAANAATEDPAAAATSGGTALAALLITIALEKQSAAVAFTNAIIEA